MVKVVGIRFRNAGKIYYFGPGKLQLKAGMHAILRLQEALRWELS